jgi:hypothetical protein
MSAVLNYNRGPELAISVMRSLFRSMCVHFYDDALLLGLSSDKGCPQQMYRGLMSLFGTLLDDGKREIMACRFDYIGAYFECSLVLSEGLLTVGPKEGRREKLNEELDNILKSGHLSGGEASSLRGKSGFMASQITGRLLRVCEQPLISRQYWETTSCLSPNLRSALLFMKAVLNHVPDRTIDFSRAVGCPILVYSDAMFEPDKPVRVGLIKFERDTQPIALTAVIPPTLVAQFEAKSTHIGQAEIFAALLLPWFLQEHVAKKPVLHFIDNQSALAGLIKSTSSKHDSQALLGTYAIMMATLECLVWAEYVESAANVSDGVSRDGLLDDMARQLGCAMFEVVIPEIPNLYELPLQTLLLNFSKTFRPQSPG